GGDLHERGVLVVDREAAVAERPIAEARRGLDHLGDPARVVAARREIDAFVADIPHVAMPHREQDRDDGEQHRREQGPHTAFEDHGTAPPPAKLRSSTQAGRRAVGVYPAALHWPLRGVVTRTSTSCSPAVTGTSNVFQPSSSLATARKRTSPSTRSSSRAGTSLRNTPLKS